MRYVRSMMAAACLLAGAPGAARAADCHFTPYSFQFGIDTSTEMTVKAGKVCGSTIRFANGGAASQMVVAQPATNGSVTTEGNGHWQYVSRRGFTGPDQFVVEVTGETMGNRQTYSGTTRIAVAVTVTP